MIEERARVVNIEGAFADIVTRPQTACGACSATTGCGTSLLAGWLPRRQNSFRLRNDIGARSGDVVVVGLEEGALQRGSLLLYALPLAGLLFGAIAGEHGAARIGLPAELGAVTLGLLGLAAALFSVRRVSGIAQQGGDAGVRLLRVVDHNPTIASRELQYAPMHEAKEFRKRE